MYLLESEEQKRKRRKAVRTRWSDDDDEEILPKASHSVLISLAISAGKGGA